MMAQDATILPKFQNPIHIYRRGISARGTHRYIIHYLCRCDWLSLTFKLLGFELFYGRFLNLFPWKFHQTSKSLLTLYPLTCLRPLQWVLVLTLRLLMSYIYIYIYIYGAPILDVSRSHTTTHHSR